MARILFRGNTFDSSYCIDSNPVLGLSTMVDSRMSYSVQSGSHDRRRRVDTVHGRITTAYAPSHNSNGLGRDGIRLGEDSVWLR